MELHEPFRYENERSSDNSGVSNQDNNSRMKAISDDNKCSNNRSESSDGYDRTNCGGFNNQSNLNSNGGGNMSSDGPSGMSRNSEDNIGNSSSSNSDQSERNNIGRYNNASNDRSHFNSNGGSNKSSNDSFIKSGNGASGGGNQSNANGISILGPTLIASEHLDLFAISINPNAIEIGDLYVYFGEYYGIRGDIAYAQALLETGYFRFGGDVRAKQNNFAGIGATGTPVRGATFSTPEEGVLAHLQHLYAYASTEALPTKYSLIDPRFRFVSRGSAKTWVDLNGKWAVPGTNYGQSILSIYRRLLDFTIARLQAMRELI